MLKTITQYANHPSRRGHARDRGGDARASPRARASPHRGVARVPARVRRRLESRASVASRIRRVERIRVDRARNTIDSFVGAFVREFVATSPRARRERGFRLDESV